MQESRKEQKTISERIINYPKIGNGRPATSDAAQRGSQPPPADLCLVGRLHAIDWFYPLTDGTGAYRILRTLLYEYSHRRYDSTLNNKGIPVYLFSSQSP